MGLRALLMGRMKMTTQEVTVPACHQRGHGVRRPGPCLGEPTHATDGGNPNSKLMATEGVTTAALWGAAGGQGPPWDG